MPQQRRAWRDPNAAEVGERRHGAAAYDLERLQDEGLPHLPADSRLPPAAPWPSMDSAYGSSSSSSGGDLLSSSAGWRAAPRTKELEEAVGHSRVVCECVTRGRGRGRARGGGET